MHSVHEGKVEQIGHVACSHGIAICRPGVNGCTQQLSYQSWPLLMLLTELISRMGLALYHNY